MKQKFAFFDFDDTLIHGDSINYLLKYYLKKHPLSIFKLFKMVFYGMLYYLKIIKINKAKNAMLFPLNKMSDQELKEFYDNCIIDKYYPNVVAELREKHDQGYIVYIVSASVEQYLKYCDLPVDKIIGTKLTLDNTSFKMIGNNCKNEEKVERIKEVLKQDNLEIDYDNSYAYSDSTHDIPMLKLVKNRIKINKKNGSMDPFEIR